MERVTFIVPWAASMSPPLQAEQLTLPQSCGYGEKDERAFP
jgi:hypothetical protein